MCLKGYVPSVRPTPCMYASQLSYGAISGRHALVEIVCGLQFVVQGSMQASLWPASVSLVISYCKCSHIKFCAIFLPSFEAKIGKKCVAVF